MIDRDPMDPGVNRQGARQFFRQYFYADFLKDQGSTTEAVDEYLASEGKDVSGELLLFEVDEILESSMSENDLAYLVEKIWDADVDSQFFGFNYKDVLAEIRDDLRRRHAAESGR